MKLGVLTVLFQERPWEETLDYLAAAGVQAVEVGTGGYGQERPLRSRISPCQQERVKPIPALR